MSKSQETYNKKEKEKKRHKKRQDKEQKKEERKANSKEGKSFDDMIAYVDEYGHPPNRIELRDFKRAMHERGKIHDIAEEYK